MRSRDRRRKWLHPMRSVTQPRSLRANSERSGGSFKFEHVSPATVTSVLSFERHIIQDFYSLPVEISDALDLLVKGLIAFGATESERVYLSN